MASNSEDMQSGAICMAITLRMDADGGCLLLSQP